jgi:hypothetical protein
MRTSLDRNETIALVTAAAGFSLARPALGQPRLGRAATNGEQVQAERHRAAHLSLTGKVTPGRFTAL